MKLQEQLNRHQKSAERRSKHITGIVQRANDESHKVKEILFIKELEKEDSKHVLDERLEKGEARRAEALAAKRQYRKGGVAVDCVLEEAQVRRKCVELFNLWPVAFFPVSIVILQTQTKTIYAVLKGLI